MSLVRAAFRIAAVEALKGRTIFGDNVLDSQAAALDAKADGSLVTDQAKPFIAVYLYDAKHERGLGELRSLFANGQCRIAFEIGIAATMTSRNDNGENEVISGFAVTDEETEFLLDMVGREVRVALSDPDNAWADVARGLAGSLDAMDLATTRHAEGQRLAGHQLMFTASLADDPVPGEAVDPDAPFGRFLALMDASDDPVRSAQVEMMRGMIATDGAPSWKILQQRMGMTADELLSLGRGPIPQDEDGETPEGVSVTVDVDGVGTTEIVP